MIPQIGATMSDEMPSRPRTRGDCESGPRPCPWYGCRHHLGLDAYPSAGDDRLRLRVMGPERMTETCALDVADRGGLTLEAVGALLGVSRERVRQIEASAMRKVRRRDSLRPATERRTSLEELYRERHERYEANPAIGNLDLAEMALLTGQEGRGGW